MKLLKTVVCSFIFFLPAVFMPDMGQIYFYGTPTFQYDHIDVHSTYQMQAPFPAVFTREDFSIQFLIKRGK